MKTKLKIKMEKQTKGKGCKKNKRKRMEVSVFDSDWLSSPSCSVCVPTCHFPPSAFLFLTLPHPPLHSLFLSRTHFFPLTPVTTGWLVSLSHSFIVSFFSSTSLLFFLLIAQPEKPPSPACMCVCVCVCVWPDRSIFSCCATFSSPRALQSTGKAICLCA